MQTESLDYYWKLAKKLIMVHGYAALLKDDENIGFVASALINADLTFDDKTGIIEGYRSMHAKFAILKLIKKHKTKIKTKNLGTNVYNKSYNDKMIHIIDCEETLSFIKQNNIINDSILEQIKDRFINNYSWSEIAKKYNIDKGIAKLNIKNGLFKIRQKLCV